METIIGLGVSVVLNIVLIAKIMLLQKKHAQYAVTEEGIRQMVDAGGSNGSIDESEKEMINNIFELSNTSVEEIATHRTDIVAVPLEATLAEIKEVLMEEKYSRIVVYEDNIDNIVGVFHVKDLVKYILTDSTRMEEGNFHLEDIMMQPYFVPFSKKTDELIEEMQREKVHMAIVIDEYGGTSGIVTMEDVMEEIVGNIFDEYDLEEEEDICPIDENSYSISGKADLQDVAEQLGIVFEDDEDYDTLGGYLIGRLGRIPEDDEMPEIAVGGWLFQIKQFEEKRIEKVYALRQPEVLEEAEDATEDEG
ncbi:hemolysin family protein [Anaerotignum lactatifermentans]|uniref:hemolysin family protein n=1 Tax=Anaerotignum lactatifermentans TaxID=160404 RepID=UPI00174A205C|nr:hemolysin family protein [Anaerotignum lactatifermentans]HJE93696.1 hemolysin family protein [Anaerotignum lactatifermentans]